MIPKIAEGLLDRARESIEGADDALRRGNLANAVSESQMTVELSVKAALLAVGVDPGRHHDVSDILRARRRRFPPSFRTDLDRWADTMADLARLREVAHYGDPRSDRTPRERFSDRGETTRAVERARSVFREIGRLFEFIR